MEESVIFDELDETSTGISSHFRDAMPTIDPQWNAFVASNPDVDWTTHADTTSTGAPMIELDSNTEYKCSEKLTRWPEPRC